MTVVLINPNSTVSMTEAALAAARAAAPELDWAGWTNAGGPPAIQSAEDGAAATPPLLELVAKAEAEGAEGIVLACFDDTGLPEARAAATCPVIGIGQASFVMATLRGDRFAVVTTTSGSVPVIGENIRAGGFGPALVHLGAAEVPVLELERDPAASAARIGAEVAVALEKGPATVVLGCAGMTHVIGLVRDACPVPVIDGVTAAALLMRGVLATARPTAAGEPG